MLDFSVLSATTSDAALFSVVYAIVLAFVLGVSNSFVYVKTFNGLSFSRNFLHSLILSPMVTCIAMQAIGDNLARGIGMVGAFSILRFRSNIKDSRDMFFLFASLSVGIACGVHSYGIAAIGSLGFYAANLILYKVPFSQEVEYDGVLRFKVGNSQAIREEMEKVLKEHCQHLSLISIREASQGERLDFSYQVKLRKKSGEGTFIQKLKSLASTQDVHLLMQEQGAEV